MGDADAGVIHLNEIPKADSFAQDKPSGCLIPALLSFRLDSSYNPDNE
jgi:hypothetical protein